MIKVDLHRQLVPKMRKRYNVRNIIHQVEKGGRESAKTSYAALKAAAVLVDKKLGAVVFMRKYHNKLSKTVFKEAVRALKRLGLKKNVHFKATVSPMQITMKCAADRKRKHFTGNKAYFTGADNVDDTKGIIDEDTPIKLVVIDELTEFFKKSYNDGKVQLQNITATFARGNDDWFVMLYIFNPPRNPKHAIFEWLNNQAKRIDTMINHSTYRDVPKKWIGRVELANIAELRRVDYESYLHIYEGISTGVKSTIYGMFDENKHMIEASVKPPKNQLKLITAGFDHGQSNAFVCLIGAWNPYTKKLQIWSEWSYSGAETGVIKTDADYKDYMIKYFNTTQNKVGIIKYVVIDPSAAGFIEEMKRAKRAGKTTGSVSGAQNDVALGISRIQKCLTFDILEIHGSCERLLHELPTYEYDEDKLLKGEEVPVKEKDHALDALRYLVMRLWPKIKKAHPILTYDEKDYEEE